LITSTRGEIVSPLNRLAVVVAAPIQGEELQGVSALEALEVLIQWGGAALERWLAEMLFGACPDAPRPPIHPTNHR
jgi:hypothetical protein